MSDFMIKFLTGVLILAIIAVIISRNAKTAQVIQAAASAFGNILAVVVAPITGNSSGGNGTSPEIVVVPDTVGGDTDPTSGQAPAEQ